MNNQGIPVCRSVFKSGESVTTVEQFTKAWSALINQLEKSKEVLAAAR